MTKTYVFFYADEFIDDLIYYNEKYGDTFECDGENLVVLATFNRGVNNELH